MRPICFLLLLPALAWVLFLSPPALAEGPDGDNGPQPLNDLGPGLYLGQYQGGLYPGGSNTMPPAHAQEGASRAAGIQPLDPAGQPDPGGHIVLLSIGISNAMQEFCGQPRLQKPCHPRSFTAGAAQHPEVDRAHLFIVNGAAGGQVASLWDDPDEQNYDQIRDQMLVPQGLGEAQVQVVWAKMGNPYPTVSLPDPQADAYAMLAFYGDILRALTVRYPNLQQVFLSSRIYAGYSTIALNPEPFAYEYGLATKWLIEAQINQASGGGVDPIAGDLDYDSAVPWVAWGPYLWADGLNPRSDGLTWVPADFQADGVHPSATVGVPKVRDLMLDFFTQDPMAVPWFTGSGGQSGAITGVADLQGRQEPSGALVRVLLWNSVIASSALGANGAYSLPAPPGAGYRLVVEASGYLRVDHPGISLSPGGSAVLPAVQLPGGDGNDDGVIDILDLSLIGGQYGLGCGDPGWDPRPDINGDCLVNISDLSLVGSNYGLQEPIFWP